MNHFPGSFELASACRIALFFNAALTKRCERSNYVSPAEMEFNFEERIFWYVLLWFVPLLMITWVSMYGSKEQSRKTLGKIVVWVMWTHSELQSLFPRTGQSVSAEPCCLWNCKWTLVWLTSVWKQVDFWQTRQGWGPNWIKDKGNRKKKRTLW